LSLSLDVQKLKGSPTPLSVLKVYRSLHPFSYWRCLVAFGYM